MMHYVKLHHEYRRIVPSPAERTLICLEPKERIRTWAYDQGIRYVLRRVTWDIPHGTAHAIWIGFYNADDAFAYKMRWG